MKKTIISVLIISLFAFALFADTVTVSDAEFTVTTTIDGVNAMKVTGAKLTNPTTEAAFGTADSFTTYAVTNHGEQENFEAYISTLSNRQSGYKVTMTAAPMGTTGADTKIHYTVSVGGTSVDTKDPTVETILTVSTLAQLTVESQLISLTVDETSYLAAPEGAYTGTVTFTYTAT